MDFLEFFFGYRWFQGFSKLGLFRTRLSALIVRVLSMTQSHGRTDSALQSPDQGLGLISTA